MLFFSLPIPADFHRESNVVIGHYSNYAIIKNEFGELFYIWGDEIQVPVGTFIENSYIRDISDLLPNQQKVIQELFGGDI